MTTFEYTQYLRQFKNEKNLNGDEDLIRYVTDNPSFSYGGVKNRQAIYSSKGWVKRKCLALPAALWSALVKTTVHVAKAVFVGMAKGIFGKPYSVKAQFYCVGRDFQEAWGWLTSLVSDRYGNFHVQEAHFYKDCYRCFGKEQRNVKVALGGLKRNKPKKAGSNEPKEADSNHVKRLDENDVIIKFSRNDIKSNKEALRKEFSTFSNEEVFEAIKQGWIRCHHMALLSDDQLRFIDFEQLDSGILSNLFFVLDVDLEDLKRCFGLISVEKFRRALNKGLLDKLDNLSDLISVEQLKSIPFSECSDDMIEKIFPDRKEKKQLNKDNFSNLNKDQFMAVLERKIIKKGIDLLSDHQISEMKLSQNICHSFFPQTHDKNQREEYKRRIDLISEDELQKALKAGWLIRVKDLPLLMSDKHLAKVKLSELPQGVVDLFSTCDSEKTAEYQKMFAKLDQTEILKALKQGLLKKQTFLPLFPLNFFSSLQISELSEEVVDFFFPNFSLQQNLSLYRERFSRLPHDSFIKALKQGLFKTYQLYFFSDAQLSSIPLADMQAEHIHNLLSAAVSKSKFATYQSYFAKFDDTQVLSAIEKGLMNNVICLNLLSDKQFKKLDLTKLSDETVNLCFKNMPLNMKKLDENMLLKYLYEKQPTDFSLLSYFPCETLIKIDLSRLSKNTCEALFKTQNINALPVETIQKALTQPNGFTESCCLKNLWPENLQQIALSKLCKEAVSNISSNQHLIMHIQPQEINLALKNKLFDETKTNGLRAKLLPTQLAAVDCWDNYAMRVIVGITMP